MGLLAESGKALHCQAMCRKFPVLVRQGQRGSSSACALPIHAGAQEHSATGGFRGHENATNRFEIMALATGPLSEQLVSPGHDLMAISMAISIHFGVLRTRRV